jgi:hypothetical protein
MPLSSRHLADRVSHALTVTRVVNIVILLTTARSLASPG